MLATRISIIETVVVSADANAAARPRPIWHEWRAVSEFGWVGFNSVAVALAAPQGPPRPVLVLPGFGAGDATTLALRAFLRSIGHHPSGWGLGLNVGAANHIGEGIDRKLQEMAQHYGCPIDIVGWSAGGIMARVLAANRQELVRQVISLGSPIVMNKDQTNIARLVTAVARLAPQAQRRIDVNVVPVASTAIWTASDGIVPGRSCRQTVSKISENVEVRGSHCGLVANPAVLYAIADRLACDSLNWQPFNPPKSLRWLYPSIENHLTAMATAPAGAGK